MRILLTGSEGYIGVILAARLLEQGHEVLGLDTGFYNDGWLYDDGGKRPHCLQMDIRDVGDEVVRGFDAVVHLAELSNDPVAQQSPRVTYEINHLGSVRLASLCKRAGVPRFVYSSSCSVYGMGSDAYQTEESPLRPQTAYARCKVLVEGALGQLCDDEFSPTILRNATAFGPSPRMRFDLVLNNLAGLALTTGEIAMTSDGRPWRPLVHVRDIADAMVCVLEAPREAVHGKTFNVGNTAQNYQVKDIAETVAQVFPGCGLRFGTSDGDNRSYRVRFDKLPAACPAFQCRYDLAAGARELRAVFQEVGLTAEIFQSRSYTRLKQLTHLISAGYVDESLFWVRR